MHTLGNIKIGQTALINSIDVENAYTEELRALGLCEGCKVTCIRKSTLGTLIHLQCNNVTVILRKKETESLKVSFL